MRSLSVFIVFALAACAVQPSGTATRGTPQPTATDSSRWLTPRHMTNAEPIRVALLLPLGSEDPGIRGLAQALRDAAELALFDQADESLLLILKDTGGTAQGAAAAARDAIGQGAELILGPLFASSVSAVAPIARAYNVPVVAFSTDISVAGDGTYLLSFQPENELDTVTRYAISQGVLNFAALIPQGQYGTRVAQIFEQSVTRHGGRLVQTEVYERNTSYVVGPVRRLANFAQRSGDLELEKQRLSEAGDEASLQALARLEDVDIWSTPGFDAVLIPEQGNLLRSLAPMLAYYDVDPRRIKFLGTGLWDDPEIVRESSLLGGWFAAPAPETRLAFAESFNQSYGRMPPRIASLAYDAVMLAAILADGSSGRRFTKAAITDPNGFFGIDGLFRFLPDGRAERGLAVIEVTRQGFQVIEPAPTSFETLGF